MQTFYLLCFSAFLPLATPALVAAQEPATRYLVTFPNLVHHEAEISATFRNNSDNALQIRIARSSPGRYALHEFGKNVYNIRVTDENGRPLPFSHPNPHQWNVHHTGTVVFSYTLFGDRADGTYAQIDQTHAHLNIPATFVYATGFEEQPVEVNFLMPENANWSAATQLPKKQRATDQIPDGNDTIAFTAPNFQYFMDSPIELAPFTWRSWKETGPNGKEQTIEIALHHTATAQLADTFAGATKQLVLEQKTIFGGLPDFDFGRYTFIACYMPHASGDGMEHRNSTILTSPGSLQNSFLDNLGTVSHEFFHAWNVERIRPQSLEPFRFHEANMSDALWLAEGFTSYYGELAMRRAGLYSDAGYLQSLEGDINAYLLLPGAHKYSPVHMSQQAPFVDAARSVDPTNRQNTYLSYYTYGSVLAVYLDLSLRARPVPLHLDGFMQLLWQRFGKSEKPYKLAQIEQALADFTQDKKFAADFFRQHIYGAELLDFAPLLAKAGVATGPKSLKPGLGPERLTKTDQGLLLQTGPISGSPFYRAGLERDDIILKINGKKATQKSLEKALAKPGPAGEIALEVWQKGQNRKINVKPEQTKAIRLSLKTENPGHEATNTKIFRANWLESRTK